MAPPIYVKGGVWTNVEDQILKAAVSKYGLTQWARVASLLPKKTAKQAKARWAEYLDPSVRASTWTKHDDAKLLDVAKLLPNQWRSVAQILGRTATQCVERYQKLLDSAVNGSDDDQENVDLTGPGIEALPALGNAFESLPSRPDAEDMDEDEREMLSEAKARLANTQGKKAKRKDRERLLNESRRIALLQKRRELKAAGVNMSLTSRNKAGRKEFDYNADIPHERVPLAGKYDVSAEERQNSDRHVAFHKSVNVKGLESKDRAPKAASPSIQAAAALVAHIDEQQAKRRKLDLPLPGAQDEARSIDSHILQTSRDLLAKAPMPGMQPPAAVPAAHAAVPDAAPAHKVSRKKVVSEFKKLLSELPEPSKKKDVPRLSDQGTALEFGLKDSHFKNADSNHNALALLRQVDEQATSSAVQLGLSIPLPDAFKTQDPDPIARLVLREASHLAQADRDSQADGLASIPLDSESRTRAEAMVEQELSAGPPRAVPEDKPSWALPESEQVMSTIYDLLLDLSASAQGLEARVASSQALLDTAQTFASVCSEIAANSEQLRALSSELVAARDLIREEDVCIEVRSATLSDLVESVHAAEKRVLKGK